MALDKLFLDVILTMAVLIYSSHAGNATTETVNSLKQSTVAAMLTTNPFVHKLAIAETLTGRRTDKSEQNLVTTEALITTSLNERLKFLDNQLTTVEEKKIETMTTNTGDTETTIENSSNSETTIGKSNNNVNTIIDVAPTVKSNKPASMKTAGLTSVKTDAPTSIKNNEPASMKTAGLTSVKTAGPATVKTGVPTSVKTDATTSVKNNEPASIKTAGPTTVKTAGPTTVKTAGPTTVKTAGPTTVKTAGPTTVKTAGPTTIKTAGLTSVTTDAPTSVKTSWPTSVKTAGLTSVKTGGPTSSALSASMSTSTECEKDMASIDNNRVYTFLCTGLQTGNTVKWYEVHNDLTSVVATCLGGPDHHCLNPDPCFNATRNGTVSELRVATTFWENTDGKMECQEIIGNEENEANLNVTLIPPKDTSGRHGGSKTTGWSPDGTTSMSRVITSTAYISHHTQDMTTVSSRSLSDQHNGEETTFTSKNSRADVSSVTTPVKGETSERTQSISKSHTPTEHGKLTTYTTSNSKTTDSEWNIESTEMRMPSYETTNRNRWSEDVTTEHTATWNNEKTNSKTTLHSQSSNTRPQTSTFVMSSSVETNSEMTSASPPTGVVTETKTLTPEYGNTTKTYVTNNLTTATDVPRGQATHTSLFQGETTFSDHFNSESTKYNAGKPGTTNTMSENVDTTPTESMFDSTTNNMTSVNEEIVSTAQTSFTKDVSEIRLTASKTVSPSASIGDKSTEYFSTLETSSSRNVSNENVLTTERYTLSTENVSSTELFSPPTSMASVQKKDNQSSGDVLVAAVAGTFSVLAAVCLTAAIFFACYKSQKLKNRIIPEITKSRDGKGGVENGLMHEMINRASRQGRGLNEPNTKNTTDFTVFVAETSLSRETRKPASTSVSTGKGFNDKISAYSFVDERTPHSRNNEHRNIKWKEAVRNVVDESSGKGRPAPKLTLKELAEIHREKRLVNSTPEGGRTVKDGDETKGVGGTHQQGHEVEVYAVVNKKKEDAALLKEKENSRAFSDKDVSSNMTDANRAKNLRDIYAIVDRSKKQDSLETRKNESDEESQALSNPNLDEATNSHLTASIEDEDIKESQLDVNTKINKPKTKQMLKMKAISSEDTPEDSIPNPDPGVCETDPAQETRLKEVIDTSLSSAEDIFANSTEPVPKPRLKRLRANVIEARLEQEQLPSRRLSVKDFPGDTGNL